MNCRRAANPSRPGSSPAKSGGDMYGFPRQADRRRGIRAYIVCPAIEENELDAGMQAVKTYYAEVGLPAAAGPPHRPSARQDEAEREGRGHAAVQRGGNWTCWSPPPSSRWGVDVPNATVMVIENAERFGLSALHQLRGRVGRGAADSCCILISDHESDAVRERLRFLCHTADGFAVARYDLETRGVPGDFFGGSPAWPAHPAGGGSGAGYPHPARRPGGSQDPAGGGPPT